MDDGRPQLQIKVADVDEPLLVDARTVRSCSDIAYTLPTSATVWDLSGILIEGQPVKRKTVIEWLNWVYVSLLGAPYNEWAHQPETTTAAELYELLAFSDSIASAPGIYRACLSDSNLRRLRIRATAADPLDLMLDGREYRFTEYLRTGYVHPIQNANSVTLTGLGTDIGPISAQSEAEIKPQVLEQVEKLLYVGYKLKLEPLLQRLHQFIAASLGTAKESYSRALIPHDQLAAIYSPRVLEAGYTEEAGRQAWIQSQLQQQQNILHGPNALFELDEDTYSGLIAKATLRRDWNGLKEGEVVDIVLDWTYFVEHRVVQVYKRTKSGLHEYGWISAALCATPDAA
eukprot:GHUV01015457.1.p1 GENE.GHUV01015457.1~~GHUV01015457.1.p1  ORF type:complete len:394 (+),score=55.18 GHUV01015457.1:153-1184(+)